MDIAIQDFNTESICQEIDVVDQLLNNPIAYLDEHGFLKVLWKAHLNTNLALGPKDK